MTDDLKKEPLVEIEERHTVRIDEMRLRRRMMPMLVKRIASAQVEEMLSIGETAQKETLNGRLDSAVNFTLLPRRALWLIQLEGLGDKPIGIIAAGDIVLGLALAKDGQPDLDLIPFEGADKGVSRRHAIIRPTKDKLMLVDLQSTNGTRINGNTVNANEDAKLTNNDLITLGGLTFTIKILATPLDFELGQDGK